MGRVRRGEAFERAIKSAHYVAEATRLIAWLRDLRDQRTEPQVLTSTTDSKDLLRLADLAGELSDWFEGSGHLQEDVGRVLALLADDETAEHGDQSDKSLEVRQNLRELRDALQATAASLPNPRTRFHGELAARFVLDCWRQVEGDDPPLSDASGAVREMQRLLLEAGWPAGSDACRKSLKRALTPPGEDNATVIRERWRQRMSRGAGTSKTKRIGKVEGPEEWSKFP